MLEPLDRNTWRDLYFLTINTWLWFLSFELTAEKKTGLQFKVSEEDESIFQNSLSFNWHQETSRVLRNQTIIWTWVPDLSVARVLAPLPSSDYAKLLNISQHHVLSPLTCHQQTACRRWAQRELRAKMNLPLWHSLHKFIQQVIIGLTSHSFMSQANVERVFEQDLHTHGKTVWADLKKETSCF